MLRNSDSVTMLFTKSTPLTYSRINEFPLHALTENVDMIQVVTAGRNCVRGKERKSPENKLRETIGSFYDLWRFAAAMSFVPYGGLPPLLSPGRANPPTLGRCAAFWTGSGLLKTSN